MNTSKQINSHLAILATNIIFGLNFVFAKNVSTQYISSEAFALLRMLGGVVVFWLIAPFFPQPKISLGSYVRLFLAALFGVSLNMITFLQGIANTSPVDASIIMTLVPLSVLLLSAIFLKEKITLIKLVGIFLGAAGAIILISYGGKLSFGGSNLKGNILCLCCVVSYTLYLIIMKPLTKVMSSFVMIRWIFLFGFMQTAPFFFNQLISAKWSIMPANTIISIGYVVIAATLITYLFTAVALNKLTTTTVSLYNYIQPVVATTAAIILGFDTFSMVKVIAALLVFTGVYLVIKKQSK